MVNLLAEPTLRAHAPIDMTHPIRSFFCALMCVTAAVSSQTLSGTVVTSTALAVSGATVTATVGTTSYTATTTATGTFTLTVPTGTYTVDVEPPGGSTFAPARLEARHVVTALNVGTITLQPGFSVSGTVLYQGGLPVANGDTDIIDAVTGQKLFTPNDNTSATGTYSMIVPAGTYKVVGDPAAGNYLSVESAAFTVTGNVTVPTITLPPGYAVTATIVDATTLAGLANVDIDVEDPTTGVRLQTPTDKTSATGAVTVVVPAGTWRINIDPPPGDAHLGQQLNNLAVFGNTNFGTLPLQTGKVVTGYVKGGTVGIYDASIGVDTVLGPVRRYTSNNGTAHDGYFNVSMPNGSYRILADPPATTAFAPTLSSNFTITANTTLADIVCPAGATLSGVVTGSNGLPENGVSVSLNTTSTGAPVTSSGLVTTTPGGYARRVPLGTNTVTYRPSRYSFSAALAVPVSVSANTTWNVQLPAASVLNFLAPGSNPTTIVHGAPLVFDAAVMNATFSNAVPNLSIILIDPAGGISTVIAPFPLALGPRQIILAPNVALPLPTVNPAHWGYPFRLRFLVTDPLSGAELDRDDLVITIT